MDYTRGTPVQVYKDGVLLREFYLDSITARRGNLFEFSCISAVGLLAERYHLGGVYFGVAAGTIIADIMDTMPYTIEADVSSTVLYGWLPYDTARANLSRVLFATGASLMKDSAGGIVIKYNQPTSSQDVSANTYYDMESSPVERYGTIRVVEHTFFDSAQQTEAVLFDNTNSVAADHALIVFEEPQASLRADGITINSSGANWAIVTGTGIVYGTAYVHIRRMLEQATGVTSVEVKEYADNALINRLNSATVMARAVNYYSNAVRHQIATRYSSEQAGGIVVFPEISGISKSGYVAVADKQVSGITKNYMNVITDWTPTGLGNQYTEYFYITSAPSGTITIPFEHRGKRALAVLFSGAQGGAGGHNGQKGSQASWYEKASGTIDYSKGYGGVGGQGGAGGTGGGCGRYLIAEIESLAASYSGAIGAGGAGGSPADYNGDESPGDIGGDTVIGSFTTADGVVPEGPYINMLDGTIYGETGGAGLAGRAGGAGGDHITTRTNGSAGENYNTVWLGGAGGLAFRDGDYQGSGAGGGGAAYGASAADVAQDNRNYKQATAGANAVAPTQASFYRGGNGGNGGGGGGGGAHYDNGGNLHTLGSGAAGGAGSVGGQGANGFILVYV
ncbi:MAG: hypothetical protein IKF99_08665 [Oscillospiraceae bacterium]|nr:hypothetical protein [Oscillospiraceae bacterium]